MKKTLFILSIMCVCFIYSCTKTEMESAKQQIEIRNEIDEPVNERAILLCALDTIGTMGWMCSGTGTHCKYLTRCQPFGKNIMDAGIDFEQNQININGIKAYNITNQFILDNYILLEEMSKEGNIKHPRELLK
jgi:hypothetical protein